MKFQPAFAHNPKLFGINNANIHMKPTMMWTKLKSTVYKKTRPKLIKEKWVQAEPIKISIGSGIGLL